MSFLPVTEALLRLEFEGLLESRPRAGTRVRIPSSQDVEGNYVVRQALETQAAILCSQMATAAERFGTSPPRRASRRIVDAIRPLDVPDAAPEAAPADRVELLEPYFQLHGAGSSRFSRAAHPPRPS